MTTCSHACAPAPPEGSIGPLPNGKAWVPLKAAVDLLPCSERTLRSILADPTLPIPTHRVGNRVLLVWPDSWDAFFALAADGVDE